MGCGGSVRGLVP